MLDLDPILILPFALVLILMALPPVSRKIWGPVRYLPVNRVYDRHNETRPTVLIDLRDQRAFAHGHIEGAINIPTDQLDTYLRATDTANETVVLVCQSDLSSTRHAARLNKAGFKNVMAMKGGMFAWKRAKYPVVKADADRSAGRAPA